MTKILVIEDAEPLRNDILEMLTFEGFEVQGAENGLVGVQVARAYNPDLIVCDIMMPELDGYDVLEALRGDSKTATIPFIFLTAKTDRADMRHGMGLGADDYLTKPFMATELLETIRARLSRQAKLDEAADSKLKELSENIITALPHELRTPLNTIIGFSEMMATEAERLKTEQVAEWGTHINEAALRLYRLVENYLTYARIETSLRDTGKIQTGTIVPTNPASIIEFQAAQRAQHHRRSDDLQLSLAPDALINIPEQDMGKIVEEVVDNAFKFSARGTPVTVTSEKSGAAFTLKITNHGHGMTDEQIQAVGAYRQFERYIQEQQGSGLGLTIARRLAELYDGELRIHSIRDETTEVMVIVPLSR